MPGRYSPADSIRHQVFFSRSMCPALFGGLPSNLMFLLLHIANIFLWHLFSSCSVEFTALAFHLTAPTAAHNVFGHFLLLRFIFTMFALSPRPLPAQPLLQCAQTAKHKCFEWQAGFQGQLSAVPRHCRKGRWGMKTCFPIKMNGVCSANKNVPSKKIKLFSRQLLALLHNTTQHHGSLTQENKREKRLKPYQWGKDILLVLLLKEYEHVREENSLDFCKRRSTAVQYNHTTHPRADFL